MDKRFRILLIIGTFGFVVVLGLIGYFSWVNIANVDTLHARVVGSLVQVRSPGAGRVVEMPIEIGDAVAADEELALVRVVGTGQSLAELMLPVRAPQDGVVVYKAVQPDEVLMPGQVIATLSDPENLWITASIHETRIPQVHVGQRVRIRIRTRSVRRRFWGKVEQVGGATMPALGAANGTGALGTPRVEVPVVISIDPAGYRLYPGMTADVRIRLSPGFGNRF